MSNHARRPGQGPGKMPGRKPPAELPEGLRPSPENDAKHASFIDLQASPAFRALMEAINGELDRYTRMDDLTDQAALGDYVNLAKQFPFGADEAKMHIYLVGLMKGLEAVIFLPARWSALYAQAKEAAAAAVPRPRIVVPASAGLRIDPIPAPAPGARADGGLNG